MDCALLSMAKASLVCLKRFASSNYGMLFLTSCSYGIPDMALHYGAMLRECIRHQSVAR